ncbi:MAG: hypothetical protein PHF33_06365 [Candidatus Delongbacteria bacterium]|jgi:hypothetical protein|nr:hypothetical protein [Candidatus Delongbacteria bacterium]MDD4205766.1 hypothetical protein [Candidatus Delongbacteria bacterium]
MNKIKAIAAAFILITLSGCVAVNSVYKSGTESVGDPYEPKVETESLRFFTSGADGLEKKYRVYNSAFREGSVDWMWYELIVRNLSDKDDGISFKEIWLDGENRIINSTQKEMNLKEKDVYLEYSAGVKTDWKEGYYVLRLFQDSIKIAEKEFKITKIR